MDFRQNVSLQSDSLRNDKKHLKRQAAAGFFFVLLLGTLSHFLYDLTGQNSFIGLFVPVSESVWEHTKLLFFPMLLYAAGLLLIQKKNRPCTGISLCFGILLGTLLIPVLYYAYTGILGKNIFFLDLAVFGISVLCAFLLFYLLAASCRLQQGFLPWTAVCILFLCFLLFTLHPPEGELFRDPESSVNRPRP